MCMHALGPRVSERQCRTCQQSSCTAGFVPGSATCAQAFDAWLPWDTNPLYALLHEAIYCQGAASGWAAQRVRDAHFSADFDAALAVANGANVMFTGVTQQVLLEMPHGTVPVPRPRPSSFSLSQLDMRPKRAARRGR